MEIETHSCQTTQAQFTPWQYAILSLAGSQNLCQTITASLLCPSMISSPTPSSEQLPSPQSSQTSCRSLCHTSTYLYSQPPVRISLPAPYCTCLYSKPPVFHDPVCLWLPGRFHPFNPPSPPSPRLSVIQIWMLYIRQYIDTSIPLPASILTPSYLPYICNDLSISHAPFLAVLPPFLPPFLPSLIPFLPASLFLHPPFPP